MTTWARFELVKRERDTAERKLAEAERRLTIALARVAVLEDANDHVSTEYDVLESVALGLQADIGVLRHAAARVVASWTDPLDDDVHGEAVAALERLVPAERAT